MAVSMEAEEDIVEDKVLDLIQTIRSLKLVSLELVEIVLFGIWAQVTFRF